ncbi:MAG: fibronectin type III domain-containing protein [Patescibacteria group bacterium]|jgi:hypothetical protein
MLVQKQATKNLRNYLLIGGIILVLLLGYLVYQKMSNSNQDLSGDSGGAKRQALPKDFGQKLFKDPRFYDLKPIAGTELVQQAMVTTLSTLLPAPENFQAFDMQSGGRIIFSWVRPALAEEATSFRIVKGQENSAKNIISLKPEETSFEYSSATNNAKESYFGYYVKEEILSQSPQILSQDGQIGGSIRIAMYQNSATLSWANPDNSGLKAIEIFRSDKIGSLGRLLVNLENNITEYEDSDSGPGLYYYTVIWVGNVTLGEKSPAVIQATDSSAPSAPQALSVKYIPESNNIELSWQPSASSDVISYEIYKSEIQNTLGINISTIEVPTNQDVSKNSLNYLDESVQPNKKFYYSVVAVDSSGNKSTQQTLGVPGNSNPFGEQ